MQVKRVGLWTTAISLIAIGVMVILHLVGVMTYSAFEYLWPAMIILFGLEVILAHATSRGGSVRYSIWSIVLLVVVAIGGLLFSAEQYLVVRLHSTFSISANKGYTEPVHGQINTQHGIDQVVIHLRNTPVTITGISSSMLSYQGNLPVQASSQQAALKLFRREWSVRKVGHTLEMTLVDKPGLHLSLGRFGSPRPYFDVHVPANLLSNVVTTNGSIQVKQMQAPVDVKSTNGALQFNDVTGKVTAHTTNGAITLQQTTKSVDAETTNGAIVGTSAVGGSWRCVTTNGSIRLQLINQPNIHVDASTTNGSFHGNIPWVKAGKRHATAKVGTSTYQMEVQTTNGGINVDAS